jgi:uncharacterized protein
MRSAWRGIRASSPGPAIALAFVLAIAACAPADPTISGSDEPDTTVPPILAGLALTTVTIGSQELSVAVADTPDSRSRGLAAIADLGPLDGMLFTFAEPTTTDFVMRGVLIPLDIAFVDAEGRVLAVRTMPLCDTDPCPTYPSPQPFRWAIETPAGGLSGVSEGDLVEIASG